VRLFGLDTDSLNHNSKSSGLKARATLDFLAAARTPLSHHFRLIAVAIIPAGLEREVHNISAAQPEGGCSPPRRAPLERTEPRPMGAEKEERQIKSLTYSHMGIC